MNRKIFFITIGWILVLFFVLGCIFYWYYEQQKNPSYAEAVGQLKVPGVLTVGGDIPFGIMEFFNDKGQPDGLEVEFAKDIADRLGVRLNYKDYNWDSLFSALENGEFDLVISSVSITPERSEKFLFSAPYFSGGQTIVIRSDNQEIKSFNDIRSKKIGVQVDTTGYMEAKKYTDKKNIVTYGNILDYDAGTGIVHDIKQGNIDLIIIDYIQAITLVKKNPTLKLLGDPFTQEYYGVMAKKGNDKLIEAVNGVIREMKHDNRLSELENKWKNY